MVARNHAGLAARAELTQFLLDYDACFIDAILRFEQAQVFASQSSQPTNDTHPTRAARAGTPVMAHRFIGCVAYDNIQ